MKNRYYLMRHAESEPNLQGLIACDPEKSIDKNGLTVKGRRQAQDSVQLFKPKASSKPIIISSDFLRAYETAQIAAKVFVTDVQLDPRLRERNFGEFSGESVSNYEEVWAISDKDPDATPYGAESARSVLDRVTDVIRDCENRYVDKDIMLVSHGDPLVIVYSYFQHGSLDKIVHHFSNAEIRPI